MLANDVNILGGKAFSAFPVTTGGGIPIDPDAEAFWLASEAAGYPIPEIYKARYNAIVYYTKQAGIWNNLSCMYLFNILDSDVSEADRKGIVLRDLKNPNNVATLKSDYAGSHVAGMGFLGNGTSFGILTEFNGGTDPIWQQNSAYYAIQFLNTTTQVFNHWAAGAPNAGYTALNMLCRPETSEGEMMCNTGTIPPTYTYRIGKGNSMQWWSGKRTASNVSKEYLNACLVSESSNASTAPVNTKTALFGVYNSGAWVNGFYTSGLQGAFIAGNGNVDDAVLQSIITQYGLSELTTAANMNKTVFSQGDSIFSAGLQGLYARMYNKTVADLNNNWTLTGLCLTNQTATNIDAQFATYTAPYYRADFLKNVLYLTPGTNDVATGIATGAQLYVIMKSICNKARVAGWQSIVIGGIISRKDGFSGGMNQATFDAQVAIYNNLMLADFAVAHGSIANYYNSNTVTYADGYINTIAEPAFSDANNTMYFQVDKIHLNGTGADYYSTVFCQPILQTF